MPTKYKAEAWNITKIEVEDSNTSGSDPVIHHRLEHHYLSSKSTLHETFDDARHHLITAAESLLKVSLGALEDAKWEYEYCKNRIQKLRNLDEYTLCQT